MKTKVSLLGVFLLAAVGLSSCYTEFAATGNDYDGQGSQGYYYDTTNSSYAYDTTGAPIVNNYNYYGYGYPSYDYNDNWWTPSPYWWHSGLWFNFGLGMNPWYDDGLAWGSPYYAYSGFGPYYNPYYYSPFYPYGGGYYYRTGNGNGRPRSFGDTRIGRENYGRGSTAPGSQPVGTSNGVGSANSSRGATSANTTQSPTTRARGSSPAPAGNTNGSADRPARARNGDSQPQSPPQEQPRARDNGNNNDGHSNQGNQSRPRGGSMSYHRSAPGPQRVRYNYLPQARPAMKASQGRGWGYSQPRAASAPRYAPSTQSSAHASSPSRSAAGRSSGGRSRR